MLTTLSINELNIVNQSRDKTDEKALETVKEIIRNVRMNQDEAVIQYTKQFDCVESKNYRVSQQEIDDAYNNIDRALVTDLTIAYQNIKTYHEKQMISEYKYNVEENSTVGQLVRPINRVGIYVPGGTAAYPSTVLMNAVPAIVAGVKEIVMISPPNKEGNISDIILAAAKVAGVNEIYKVGGAQGIAALAYGTKTIPSVSKIVGPGNIYVALAKKEVFGKVGIDMIAGPSEILIYADDTSNPRYIAADLLSQAEHDELARVILVTNSSSLIEKVNVELTLQLDTLSRKEIAMKAILNNGYAVLVDNEEEALRAVNSIAPEHLELLVNNVEDLIPKITNAGAIFVGEYSPEPLGDYIAGPNHTLPTSGSATFSSPLSTDDFLKKTSYINFSYNGLKQYKDSMLYIYLFLS